MAFINEYKHLLEQFDSIKTVKREFYPRKLKLSLEFAHHVRKEHQRLVKDGIHPKKALHGLLKAIPFHCR